MDETYEQLKKRANALEDEMPQGGYEEKQGELPPGEKSLLEEKLERLKLNELGTLRDIAFRMRVLAEDIEEILRNKQ